MNRITYFELGFTYVNLSIELSFDKSERTFVECALLMFYAFMATIFLNEVC